MKKNGADITGGGRPSSSSFEAHRQKGAAGVPPIWRVAAVVFGLICLALTVALVVIAARPPPKADGDGLGSTAAMPQTRPRPAWSDVYRGMSASEYDAVRDFLLGRAELNLTRAAQADLDSNYIFLIEDHLPSKSDALEYRRRGGVGAAPVRRAKVVLFMGAERPKRVRELLVLPVGQPGPTMTLEPYNNTSERPIAWSSRPLCLHVELRLLDAYLRRELRPLRRLLNDSFGQWLDDECGARCIFYNAAPRTGRGGERYVYLWFYLNFERLPGYYLHPVSFYAIVEVPPAVGNSFSVKYVYFEDRRFDSVEALRAAYESGDATRRPPPPPPSPAQPQSQPTSLPQPDSADRYGSPKRRGLDPNPTERRPPAHLYPDGRRFSVDGAHVRYMSWSFDVYFRSVSGVELFNVAFDGESVAYEIGMQDILASYSGAEPENFFKAYFDNGWSLGTRAHPLMRDVDCPPGAVYLDAQLYAPGSDASTRMADTACAFEYRNSVPLRRHYSEDFYGGGANFVFSMPDSVLVVRQAITLWNYDYVFDYEFHQNGVVEAKVSSTGYVAATVNRRPEYGTTIDRRTGAGANVHVHLFNFKFDLDVSDGGQNQFVTVDLTSDNATANPLAADPSAPWRQTRVVERLRKTEAEAVMHYDFGTPRYLVVRHANRTNALGYRKAYRLQSGSFLKMLLPDSSAVMTGASWARSQLCVTRVKDTERGTASIYTQGYPERPVVDFSSFYADNESIDGEDLVVWATIGMLHVPTAEDVPVTTTPGKTLSVVLAPFGFFDEDPSIRSKDAVVKLKGDGS